MSFLLNKDYIDKKTTSPFTAWECPNSDQNFTCILPCTNNKNGWKCACSRAQTKQVKSTQTEDSIEHLLGKLILKHCPDPYLVKNYVKHINTSTKLVQLLTKDTLPDLQFHNGQSHSNE